MPHTTVGKIESMKILYGDSGDIIDQFKIGDGTNPITSNNTDLGSPISYGSPTPSELHPINGHSLDEPTRTMESSCIVTTTDYQGNVSEWGLFSTSGIMIMGDGFPTYAKDGNTNLKFIGRDRHL